MPSQRFLNLPAEKRERILCAAREELSRVPVDEMSINRLVQGAGIPRGSFYQYFTGKDDLLRYLMREYSGLLDEHIDRVLVESGGDMFRVFTAILGCTIEFGQSPKYRRLFRNVFTHLHLDEEAPGSAIEFNKRELFARFKGKIDTRRWQYQGEEDVWLVFEMALLLFRRALSGVFRSEEARGEVQRRFARQLEILQSGVCSGAAAEGKA